MGKKLPIIYPRLDKEMEKKFHCAKTIAGLLKKSPDAVRKKLKGEVDFELKEGITVADFYGVDVKELFAKTPKNNASENNDEKVLKI